MAFSQSNELVLEMHGPVPPAESRLIPSACVCLRYATFSYTVPIFTDGLPYDFIHEFQDTLRLVYLDLRADFSFERFL